MTEYNEFTVNRVKSKLSEFMLKVDSLIESEHTTRENVETFLSDLNMEKELAENNINTVIQESNYVPALEEAIMHTEKGLEADNIERCFDALRDASFSIGYFLNH
ncbi:MAG: hypothetical protein KUG82_07880 [Pseudomonadales bacterium]|nr:hypothetical protein [Pseudomonadales bacterium]